MTCTRIVLMIPLIIYMYITCTYSFKLGSLQYYHLYCIGALYMYIYMEGASCRSTKSDHNYARLLKFACDAVILTHAHTNKLTCALYTQLVWYWNSMEPVLHMCIHAFSA